MAIMNRTVQLKRHIEALTDDLLAHDGFANLTIEMRLLRRGQKEVIVHCEKQYRYVVDFASGRTPTDSRSDDVGSCSTNLAQLALPHDPVTGRREHTDKG